MSESVRSGSRKSTRSGATSLPKILVCARLRPIIPEDHKSTVTLRNAPEICVHLKRDGQTIKLVQNLYSSRCFQVDNTFDPGSSQIDVYHQTLKPIVTDALVGGYNGTAIAYGQTGSGKTYTMFGNHIKLGITHFAVNDIFECVQRYEENHFVAKVYMSFYQIYMDQVYDLLGNNFTQGKPVLQPLTIREDQQKGVYIEDINQLVVSDKETAYKLIQLALEHRKSYSTVHNIRSSRSHAILQLSIDLEETIPVTGITGVVPSSSASYTTSSSSRHSSYHYNQPMANEIVSEFPVQEQNHTTTKYVMRRRKLLLVDLAGSERIPRYKHTPANVMKEACVINKSLAALGNVVMALSSNAHQMAPSSSDASTVGHQAHIPFRDSKLTRLLAEGMTGASRLCVIATISPCTFNYDETFATLKFATRAKIIKPVLQRANSADSWRTGVRSNRSGGHGNLRMDGGGGESLFGSVASPLATREDMMLSYPTPPQEDDEGRYYDGMNQNNEDNNPSSPYSPELFKLMVTSPHSSLNPIYNNTSSSPSKAKDYLFKEFVASPTPASSSSAANDFVLPVVRLGHDGQVQRTAFNVKEFLTACRLAVQIKNTHAEDFVGSEEKEMLVSPQPKMGHLLTTTDPIATSISGDEGENYDKIVPTTHNIGTSTSSPSIRATSPRAIAPTASSSPKASSSSSHIPFATPPRAATHQTPLNTTYHTPTSAVHDAANHSQFMMDYFSHHPSSSSSHFMGSPIPKLTVNRGVQTFSLPFSNGGLVRVARSFDGSLNDFTDYALLHRDESTEIEPELLLTSTSLDDTQTSSLVALAGLDPLQLALMIQQMQTKIQEQQFTIHELQEYILKS